MKAYLHIKGGDFVIITFCGHSDFRPNEEYERQILALLEDFAGDTPTECFLGEYGSFDRFAYSCCKKYQATHPKLRLILVTPYQNESVLSRQRQWYDEIVYPDIENRPPRVAILYRNRYMVDRADLVIAYVERQFGGAYKTYRYAEKRKKPIRNLTVLP